MMQYYGIRNQEGLFISLKEDMDGDYMVIESPLIQLFTELEVKQFFNSYKHDGRYKDGILYHNMMRDYSAPRKAVKLKVTIEIEEEEE